MTTIAKAHQAAVRTAPRFALAWLLFLYILVLTLIVQRSSNTWVYYEGEERNG